MAYSAKVSGFTFYAPTNNPAVILDGTWTLSLWISPINSPTSGTQAPGSVGYTTDGSEFTYVTNGTELTTPGKFILEFRAVKGTAKFVARTVVDVEPSFL